MIGRELSDRGTFIAGDFFESLPRVADAIIMKSIIHDWDDGRSKVILRNCRSALSEGGRLLLVERLMSETPGDNVSDRANALSDLNMLRGPGGAERTEREYRSLLAESGFKTNRTLPAGRSRSSRPSQLSAARRSRAVEASASLTSPRLTDEAGQRRADCRPPRAAPRSRSLPGLLARRWLAPPGRTAHPA